MSTFLTEKEDIENEINEIVTDTDEPSYPLHTTESLAIACMTGDIARLRDHIGGRSLGRFDLNANYDGHTLISLCSMGGHSDCVRELLRHSVNANAKDIHGDFPLLLSVKGGHYETTDVLLQHGVSVNQLSNRGLSALHWCASNGDIALAKNLIVRGAVIDSCGIDRHTPLFTAASRGQTEMCIFLLSHGANVNYRKFGSSTPLFAACGQGHVGTARHLILRGANVNVMTVDGDTPLLTACRGQHLAVVEMLIDKGADVNMGAGRSSTPLQVASQNGHLNMVKLLLAKKASVNCSNHVGWTALHFACATDVHRKDSDSRTIALLLCEHGADLLAMCKGPSNYHNILVLAANVTPLKLLNNCISNYEVDISLNHNDDAALSPPSSFLELDELKAFVKKIEYTFRCQTNWNRRKDFILVLYNSKIVGLFSAKKKSVDVNVSDDDSLSRMNGSDNAAAGDIDGSIGVDNMGSSSSSSSISNSNDNDIGPRGIGSNSMSSDNNSRILSINGSQPTPKTAMMKVFESKDMITSILRLI